MGSSRSTGNCDRSSPRSPTTPHPTSTPTPSSVTPRRNHETKPPRTPLSAMHQSNHTTHRAKRNPSEKTRPTTSHENKPHQHAPPVLPIQPANTLTRPHVTTTTNTEAYSQPSSSAPWLGVLLAATLSVNKPHASRFRTHPNFTHPHSRLLKNPNPDYQIGRIIIRNRDATFTPRIIFLTMPYHPGRQAGLVFLLPPRLLGKSDGPIKNLLPISITQGEHPPHLGEPGLTQGTPVPLVGALLQGQTQQILRRHGILQKHRQLRPILPQITHNTTPNQHPHTQQRHTPTQPRNKTATNPTIRHAPIQPHHPPRQEKSIRKNATHNVTREQTPPTRTTQPTHPAS